MSVISMRCIITKFLFTILILLCFISCASTEIYSYSDDLALVYYNGEYNYLDTKGNLVLDKGYQIASPFNSGVAIVYVVYGGDNNEAYIIDKEGNRIADLSKYTLLVPFANGTCVADDNEEAYLLDTKGNVIYPKEN